MSRTAQNMQKLIQNKFYPVKEVALEKLDLLMLASRISGNEYRDLVLLAEQMYPAPVEPVPETPAEPKPTA